MTDSRLCVSYMRPSIKKIGNLLGGVRTLVRIESLAKRPMWRAVVLFGCPEKSHSPRFALVFSCSPKDCGARRREPD